MALTRDQVITLVLARLDRREDTDLRMDLETEIILLQEQTLEGAPFKPWFLEQVDSDLVSSVGAGTIPLPTGFLRLQEDDAFSRYDATISKPDQWLRLTKDTLDAVVAQFKDKDAGPPLAYAIFASGLLVRPFPDAVYTFRLRYYKRDVSLTSNIANNWTANAADVVVNELCKMSAQVYLKDELMVEKFETLTRQAWDRLRIEHVARANAAADYEMGD